MNAAVACAALALLLAGCAVPAPAPASPVAVAEIAAWTPTPQPGLSLRLEDGQTARTLTVEQWRAVLAFPEAQQYRAARTMICESGGNAGEIGALGEVGLFQIHPIHGFSAEQLRDPLFNALVAAELLAERPDWGDWAATRNGCEEWNR